MILYYLEEVLFEGIDQNAGERIEIRIGQGFWVNKRKLDLCKRKISKSLGSGWSLVVTKFKMQISKRQKYLYILNFEYYLDDGTCCFYQFEPQTSIFKCNEQKKNLQKETKYADDPKRIYKVGKGGWFVDKLEIVY